MSIDNATEEEWNTAAKKYIKAIDEAIIEEESNCVNLRPNMVDKPPHYNQGGIEAIDYIKQQLGDGFVEYCEGNVMKYLHRWRYKNGIEDLKKAEWYLERMIEKLVEID